jgi:hypothetical protein
MSAQPEGRSLRHFFAGLVKAWDRFWFRPSDPTTLGLIRILAGLMLLYIHIAYTPDLQSFFGKNAWFDLKLADDFRHDFPSAMPYSGWKPDPGKERTDEELAYRRKWGLQQEVPLQDVGARGQYRWSLWYHVTDPTAMMAIHIATLLVMFLFTIGLWTRVTGALSWISMLSYIQRAPTVLFGVDAMMNMGVLYLVIGPSGAALSVDRLLRHYLARKRAARENLPEPVFGPPAPSASANFAIRLMQINVCLVYLISGLSKLKGDTWLAGTACWGVMANYEFSPMGSPLYMFLLRTLSEHRLLWEITITSATYFTLAFESSFIYLIWSRRLRWTMLVAAVFMHLGIAICMGLVTFSMMMLILVVSMVPPSAVRQLIERVTQGTKATLQLAPQEANGHRRQSPHAISETVQRSGRA